MKPKNTPKFLSTALAIIALAATLILLHQPTRAQSAVDSDDLATFVAVMQYIRSTPTPADVKADKIPVLAALDTAFSDMYITGFITPYTGETPEQVKARLQSVTTENRFTAVMVESYRHASNPLLLNIVHQLLPLYYVEFFTTAEDLNASAEFLKSANIAKLADGFDSSDYTIPAPSATGTIPPSTRGPSAVNSDDLAKFVAIMHYIRSTPTPADVKADTIPVLAALDTAFSDMYITGFITPYTGETPEQVKARLQSVTTENRFTAVMVESYRHASNPLLLNIVHQLLPLYYVEFFTTAEDLNASAEFLKRADIQNLADAFDSDTYSIPAPDTGTPATDRDALITLYNATDGPNWENNTNWLTNKPLEEWHGVYINQGHGGIPLDSEGRVTFLYLSNNGLTGTIPPELGNLSALRDLQLGNNGLTGPIPPELGNLSNLSFLLLSNNQLTGSIPPELGNLSSLQNLFLNNNQLTGSIPPELGNIPRLFQLNLAGNQLTGCIPNALLNVSSHDFAQLGLSFCSPVASDPSDRAALKALYESTDGENWTNNTSWGNDDQPLQLWYGVITDTDGRVTSLNLSYNQLSGSIPPELGSLANLQWLYLNGNQLSGSIPPELGNLSKLQEIWLSDNQLTGCIPNALLNVSSHDLAQLGLSFCSSVASNPADRAALEALYESTDGENWYSNGNWGNDDQPLQLWHGVTTDTDGRVTGLSLNFNQLNGAIPAELGNLTNLTSLYLSNNQLSGNIPPELGNLTNLTELGLSNNQLSGNIPPELGNLTNLIALWLSGNQFTGCIPDALRSVRHNDLDNLNLPFCAQ